MKKFLRNEVIETLLHIHQDQLETNVFSKDTERMYLRVNYEVEILLFRLEYSLKGTNVEIENFRNFTFLFFLDFPLFFPSLPFLSL